ncbi:MAG: hypothetical protein ACRD2O_02135 [Terriglobia bacterium]
MQHDSSKLTSGTFGGTEVTGTTSSYIGPNAGGKNLFRNLLCSLLGVALVIFFAGPMAQAHDNDTFLPLPNAMRSVSTMPSNGDVNPYGVAFVPGSFPQTGMLKQGDVLVSNFNNNQNLQGTGTTIIRIPVNGSPTLFFQEKAPLGLSTALNVLKGGYVVVGNFPTADGTCATAQPGSILVINSAGKPVSTLTNSLIDGPWDSTVYDQGNTAKLFVSNALNGTVVRLDLAVSQSGVSIVKATQVASGFMHRCDPAALVVAPTGLVYDAHKDVLYVASTEDNAVFSVPNAGTSSTDQGTGEEIYQDQVHLHGALAMTLAPNGDLLVTNSDVINSDPNQPSEIVEFTTTGAFVRELPVDPNQGGSFGLAVISTSASNNTAQLAAVDDNALTLTIWNIPLD